MDESSNDFVFDFAKEPEEQTSGFSFIPSSAKYNRIQ